MPKFMKQVRNFLNNSPFKMYKNTPLRGMQAPEKQEKKVNKNRTDKTYNQAYKEMTEEKRKTFKGKGDFVKKAEDWWAKQDAKKPTTGKAEVLNPVTVTADRIKSINSEIKQPPAREIKKVTKEELAANAKIAKNKKIAAKAKAAMDKKKAAAAGQTQNMKDKIKLKAEIKDKRKSTTRKERKKDVKYQDKDTGKNVSAQDQLKAKRKEKRVKSKAIRKYKNNPDNMKVAKVKKASAAKMYKKKK